MEVRADRFVYFPITKLKLQRMLVERLSEIAADIRNHSMIAHG